MRIGCSIFQFCVFGFANHRYPSLSAKLPDTAITVACNRYSAPSNILLFWVHRAACVGCKCLPNFKIACTVWSYAGGKLPTIAPHARTAQISQTSEGQSTVGWPFVEIPYDDLRAFDRVAADGERFHQRKLVEGQVVRTMQLPQLIYGSTEQRSPALTFCTAGPNRSPLVASSCQFPGLPQLLSSARPSRYHSFCWSRGECSPLTLRRLGPVSPGPFLRHHRAVRLWEEHLAESHCRHCSWRGRGGDLLGWSQSHG